MAQIPEQMIRPQYIRKPRNKKEELAYILMKYRHGKVHNNIDPPCPCCMDLAARLMPDLETMFGKKLI